VRDANRRHAEHGAKMEGETGPAGMIHAGGIDQEDGRAKPQPADCRLE
jgi:hypothetical protein